MFYISPMERVQDNPCQLSNVAPFGRINEVTSPRRLGLMDEIKRLIDEDVRRVQRTEELRRLIEEQRDKITRGSHYIIETEEGFAPSYRAELESIETSVENRELETLQSEMSPRFDFCRDFDSVPAELHKDVVLALIEALRICDGHERYTDLQIPWERLQRLDKQVALALLATEYGGSTLDSNLACFEGLDKTVVEKRISVKPDIGWGFRTMYHLTADELIDMWRANNRKKRGKEPRKPNTSKLLRRIKKSESVVRLMREEVFPNFDEFDRSIAFALIERRCGGIVLGNIDRFSDLYPDMELAARSISGSSHLEIYRIVEFFEFVGVELNYDELMRRLIEMGTQPNLLRHFARIIRRKKCGFNRDTCRKLVEIGETDAARFSYALFGMTKHEGRAMIEEVKKETFNRERGGAKISAIICRIGRFVASIGDRFSACP